MADGGSPAFAPFLGVARSFAGRVWRHRPADEAVARSHALRFGLSEPLARALASRGVDEAQAADYLAPTLKALFPDPSCFSDMDLAAQILVDAVVTARNCVVFADYDVDGATSAALLIRWFRAMGRDLPVYVPDRILEGYGPSPAAFKHLKEQCAELVVTVDCGAAAHDALAAAAAIGLDVVVIDHHLMRGEPPPAAALVNPNRPDCLSGQGNLAAAGVTFVLLAALNREARKRGLFEDRDEPGIRAWLDLAALGAVCDVTALTGFNRALTSQGLKVMSSWANPGLKALMAVAQSAEGPASVFHAGFVLGPRINAGGRIGRSDLGARLLSTDDPAEAQALAEELDALNLARKGVEKDAFDAAVRHLERTGNVDPDDPVILVHDDGWHPGVVGIVAGRLRERYRKPAIVIGVDRAADVGKGSGRSQPGVNLGRAIQAAFEEGLLLAGGGHAMAAGLTVRPAMIPDLRAFLSRTLAVEQAAAEAADALDIDALISPSVGRPMLDEFKRLEPFGPGAPEPCFALAGALVLDSMPMRGGHVRATLGDGAGAKLKAVAWRAEETELGRRLLARDGSLHLAGKLKADDWKGREGVQIEIEDGADPRRCG